MMAVMKSIIVAYDKNRGIGAKNDLLWLRDLPADLQHFKELTMGGAIIMGRKTHESIGRPLPGRQNIVISRKPTQIDGVTVVGSLQAAYDAVDNREIFVIGGAQIYSLVINTVDRIFATEVKVTFEQADTFFPAIDMKQWRETDRRAHRADERNLYDYDFVTYLHR
jgi:dihydrofolate reductase